jgi:hypothetical protein
VYGQLEFRLFLSLSRCLLPFDFIYSKLSFLSD